MTSVNVGDDVLAAQINQLLLKPLVRLVATSTQSIAHNTAVAIQFGTSSEEIDTHNWHDVSTNNTRIIPNIPGYYRARGAVAFGSRNDYTHVNCWIRKGGATNMAAAWRSGYSTSSGTLVAAIWIVTTEVIVSCDGTSADYIELVAQHQNGASAAQITNQSGQFSSVLEMEFLRPLT